MEQRRLYPDMTAEEQLQWVTDFEALMRDGGGRIIDMARSRQSQWQPEDALTVRRLVGTLAAWPFAQDFAEKAQRYGDYMARATRLPVYVDKVMERLADGLTMTDKDGRTVAYVSPSAPLRRRGRPSREELAARQRGEQPQGAEPDDAEARKRRTVARMLGLDVIVSGSAPREKNNAELKAERDRRRAEYERQNPSLFGGASGTGTCVSSADASARQEPVPSAARESMGTGSLQQSDATASGAQVPVPSESQCPTMSEIYADRIETDRKLHMDQLKWLCSDALKRRIEMYHGQRSTFEDASTRAKTMADMGAKPAQVEPWAKVAEDNLKEYKQTEADIDQELAILFRRLSIDQPFTDHFRARFKGVDVEKILYITRPYYEKVKENERADTDRMAEKGIITIDERIRLLIERDNPEYAARLKAEEEKKQEMQALHRYIMRKDKDASDDRVKTMTERIERIRKLAGDEVADSYLPVLEKTKADNIAWRAAKGKDEPEPKPESEKKPKPEKKSSSKKSAKKD